MGSPLRELAKRGLDPRDLEPTPSGQELQKWWNGMRVNKDDMKDRLDKLKRECCCDITKAEVFFTKRKPEDCKHPYTIVRFTRGDSKEIEEAKIFGILLDNTPVEDLIRLIEQPTTDTWNIREESTYL